jgi:hypothetical protein
MMIASHALSRLVTPRSASGAKVPISLFRILHVLEVFWVVGSLSGRVTSDLGRQSHR